MDFRGFTLSNGIRVVVAPRLPGDPVSLQVWFLCGSRTESEDEDGLAHFNEHMFFKGGRDFPDSRSVMRELRRLGDQYNALTMAEAVMYFITAAPNHVRRALVVLSDMLIHARMETAEIEKERGIILQELKRMRDDPEDFSDHEFNRFLYGTHPLGRTGIGTEELIGRFVTEDVLGYKNRFYGPPNAVISVAGYFDVTEMTELLELYFGGISQKDSVAWQPFCVEPGYESAKFLSRPGVEQAHVHIGGFIPSYKSPDARAIALLTEILSERLWWSVREDGPHAYKVFAAPRLYSDIGNFLIYAGIDAEEKKITETLRIILYEMRDIMLGNISEAEINDAKIMLRGRLSLSLDGSHYIALFLGSHETHFGRPKTVSEIHGEIDRITKDDLVRLAREVWREENVRSLTLATSFSRYEEKFLELRRMLGG